MGMDGHGTNSGKSSVVKTYHEEIEEELKNLVNHHKSKPATTYYASKRLVNHHQFGAYGSTFACFP
jgi:predicted AAA+ superfamily ATPase